MAGAKAVQEVCPLLRREGTLRNHLDRSWRSRTSTSWWNSIATTRWTNGSRASRVGGLTGLSERSPTRLGQFFLAATGTGEATGGASG
jgi:hypothetical protein